MWMVIIWCHKYWAYLFARKPYYWILHIRDISFSLVYYQHSYIPIYDYKVGLAWYQNQKNHFQVSICYFFIDRLEFYYPSYISWSPWYFSDRWFLSFNNWGYFSFYIFTLLCLDIVLLHLPLSRKIQRCFKVRSAQKWNWTK